MAYCRHRRATTETNAERKNSELNKALLEIRAFVSLQQDLNGSTWDKWDDLYQQIQKDAGETPQSLRGENVKVDADRGND